MTEPEYYVRLVELPKTVEGVTLPNADGSFDIYINSRYPDRSRQEILAHELRHLKLEHFTLEVPLRRAERQADGEPVNVVLHQTPGVIPHFYSAQAFAHWVNTVARQAGADLKKADILSR